MSVRISLLIRQLQIRLQKQASNDNPPWINNDVRKAVRNKKKAWNKYYYSKTIANLEHFKRKRNQATTTIRKAKRDFEKRLARQIRENLRSF